MNRAVHIFLVILIVVGSFLAVREGFQQRAVARRHHELALRYGNLDITDTAKIYAVAIPSDGPDHFQWRVFLPASLPAEFRSKAGHSGESQSSSERDFILQVRIRRDNNKRIGVFTQYDMGASVMQIGDAQLQDFLHDRWDQLEVIQHGKDGVAIHSPDEIIRLLEIRLPESMVVEARKTLTTNWNRHFVPTVLDLEFGPSAEFDKRDEERRKEMASP